MNAGTVAVLVILGANPVFTAPADLKFAAAMAKVPLTVHLGLHRDETAMHSQWHVPETHYLETWSDARAGDGTVTVCQPLIEPLYECRSAHEVVAALAGETKTPLEIVRDFWRANWEGRAAGTFGTLTDADRPRLRQLREVLAARAARRLRARHGVHAEDRWRSPPARWPRRPPRRRPPASR